MGILFVDAGLTAFTQAALTSENIRIQRLRIGTIPNASLYDAVASAVALMDSSPQVYNTGIDLVTFQGGQTNYQFQLGATPADLVASEVGFYDDDDELRLLWANAGAQLFTKPAASTLSFNFGYSVDAGVPTDVTVSVTQYAIASRDDAEAGLNNLDLMTPLRTAQAIEALAQTTLPSNIVASRAAAASLALADLLMIANSDVIGMPDQYATIQEIFGLLTAALVPNLSANKITTGQLGLNRLPPAIITNLDAANPARSDRVSFANVSDIGDPDVRTTIATLLGLIVAGDLPQSVLTSDPTQSQINNLPDGGSILVRDTTAFSP